MIDTSSPDPPCPPLLLPSRSRDSHKGDYGRVLLVGGSRGMAGSISLSAMAAMRSGSGLVSVLIPDRCLETVAGFDPCVMSNVPRVFDADALNILAQGSDEYRMDGPAVLTPHPGEMKRLVGVSASDRDGQIEAAVKLAATLNVVVLLKGARTFVTDGKERWFNTTGNPGMAKGGSGDCLTGIVTAFLARGDSAHFGVMTYESVELRYQ